MAASKSTGGQAQESKVQSPLVVALGAAALKRVAIARAGLAEGKTECGVLLWGKRRFRAKQ